MRWRCVPVPTPSENDQRSVRKFAWLPVQIKDHKIWLESYETIEIYTKRVVYEEGSIEWIFEWRELHPKYRVTLDYYV